MMALVTTCVNEQCVMEEGRKKRRVQVNKVVFDHHSFPRLNGIVELLIDERGFKLGDRKVGLNTIYITHSKSRQNQGKERLDIPKSSSSNAFTGLLLLFLFYFSSSSIAVINSKVVGSYFWFQISWVDKEVTLLPLNY